MTHSNVVQVDNVTWILQLSSSASPLHSRHLIYDIFLRISPSRVPVSFLETTWLYNNEMLHWEMASVKSVALNISEGFSQLLLFDQSFLHPFIFYVVFPSTKIVPFHYVVELSNELQQKVSIRCGRSALLFCALPWRVVAAEWSVIRPATPPEQCLQRRRFGCCGFAEGISAPVSVFEGSTEAFLCREWPPLHPRCPLFRCFNLFGAWFKASWCNEVLCLIWHTKGASGGTPKRNQTTTVTDEWLIVTESIYPIHLINVIIFVKVVSFEPVNKHFRDVFRNAHWPLWWPIAYTYLEGKP